MTSNQLASIQQSTTGIALNEELSAASDSCIIEKDVIKFSEIIPAQSAPSEFEPYLNFSDEGHFFSDADFAYSELITGKFNEVLCIVEKLEE